MNYFMNYYYYYRKTLTCVLRHVRRLLCQIKFPTSNDF